MKFVDVTLYLLLKSCISNVVDLTCILKKKPKLKELVSLLRDIDYKWEKIGITLDVKDHVLCGLKESIDDNTTKLITVLRSWMNTFPSNSTWDVVLAAVKDPIVNHASIALKIRQYLAKPEVQSKYDVK